MGSWVNYGLGSVNENLPGFVVMLDPAGGPISGAKNWSSGYMPATYQGTIMRSKGAPIIDLNLPAGTTRDMQRELLDALREANSDHLATRGDNSELAARISSYELAYKMQQFAPEAVDLSQESAETLKLYGVDQRPHGRFRQTLPAGPAARRTGRAIHTVIFRRAIITTRIGTPMATWSRTIPSMPAIRISQLRHC